MSWAEQDAIMRREMGRQAWREQDERRRLNRRELVRSGAVYGKGKWAEPPSTVIARTRDRAQAERLACAASRRSGKSITVGLSKHGALHWVLWPEGAAPAGQAYVEVFARENVCVRRDPVAPSSDPRSRWR